MTHSAMRYRATARRSGQWWAVTVPELTGVFTQAKRLNQVAEAAREAVALFLDVDPTTVKIAVDPVQPAASAG